MTKPKSGRYPWMKFKVRTWLSDVELNACSIGAQGLWIKLICFIHEADAGGFLLIGGKVPTQAQLAKAAGITEREYVALERELEEAGVFSRRDHDRAIFCRLNRREAEADGAPDGCPSGPPPSPEGLPPSRALSLSSLSSSSDGGPGGSPDLVPECIEHWRREWARTRAGTKATVRDKDRASVGWMLSQETPETVRRRMTAILEDSDPFMVKNASLRMLESKWDAYAVAASTNGKVHAPETPEQTDLRERWAVFESRRARDEQRGVRPFPGFDAARAELERKAAS